MNDKGKIIKKNFRNESKCVLNRKIVFWLNKTHKFNLSLRILLCVKGTVFQYSFTHTGYALLSCLLFTAALFMEFRVLR